MSGSFGTEETRLAAPSGTPAGRPPVHLFAPAESAVAVRNAATAARIESRRRVLALIVASCSRREVVAEIESPTGARPYMRRPISVLRRARGRRRLSGRGGR